MLHMSREFLQTARHPIMLPTMTFSDTGLEKWMHLAHQCSTGNCLLPENLIFPKLRSDVIPYVVHVNAMRLDLFKCKTCTLYPVTETLPQN